jgi:hypothetical protein
MHYLNNIVALQQLLFSGQPPTSNSKEEGDNKKMSIAI